MNKERNLNTDITIGFIGGLIFYSTLFYFLW